MTELKPCPFCGRMPNIIERKTSTKSNFRIECKNMNCQIIVGTFAFLTVEEAIEAWNRRVDND